MTDTEFGRFLIEKIGVAAVPGSSFYHEGGETKFRFTFSKKTGRWKRPARRLEKLEEIAL